MKAQRDIAHANDTTSTLVLIIHIGNAGIAESTLSIGGHFILDGKKRKENLRIHFISSWVHLKVLPVAKLLLLQKLHPILPLKTKP